MVQFVGVQRPRYKAGDFLSSHLGGRTAHGYLSSMVRDFLAKVRLSPTSTVLDYTSRRRGFY